MGNLVGAHAKLERRDDERGVIWWRGADLWPFWVKPEWPESPPRPSFSMGEAVIWREGAADSVDSGVHDASFIFLVLLAVFLCGFLVK